MQLWFDVTHPTFEDAQPRDVRELTGGVTFFITPKGDKKSPETFITPAVKFHWGAFSFIGVMESLEETLELFSSEGRALRASVSFGLTQQEILAFQKGNGIKLPSVAGVSGSRPAGTVPLVSASAGASLQSLADSAGASGVNWQDIAAANGIENPRLLAPGQLLNLNATLRVRS
ncbi:MAG: LysM domain-containing protein [Sphingomonadales bacterium]|nr:MAG: LysM domain-containing protein [Sphingomonadales bacterium]